MPERRKVVLWRPNRATLRPALEHAASILDGSGHSGSLEVLLVLAAGDIDLDVVDAARRLVGYNDTLCVLISVDDLELVDYPLLRRLQRSDAALALGLRADDLVDRSRLPVGEGADSLEARTELAQKFRVNVDFFLTLPKRRTEPSDAADLLRFLVALRVRRVSFGSPLLLHRMGLQERRPPIAKVERFMSALIAGWLTVPASLHFEDLHVLAGKVLSARKLGGVPANSPLHSYGLFFETSSVYWNADGPVPELAVADTKEDDPSPNALQRQSRQCCQRTCEFFLICGGDMYGAKAAFNGTVLSSHNPYCREVAQPLFRRLLAIQ